jgi:hypothetical protein
MVHIEKQSNTHIKEFLQSVHENFSLPDDQTMDLHGHQFWFDSEYIALGVLFRDSNDMLHNNDEFGKVQT